MSLKTRIVFVIISAACCFSFCSIAAKAQETPDAKPAPSRLQLEKADFEAKAPVAKDFTLTQRRVKRLPNFYRDVVNEKQKEQIYQIQDEYYPYITMLNERIQKLRAEQDAKIKATLSQHQVAEIEKLAEESKARRAANAREQAEE